jgi:hypothetical protein
VLQQQRGSPAAAAWHQDFMNQQPSTVHEPQRQQNGYQNVSVEFGTRGYATSSFQRPMGLGGFNGGLTQGKQPMQEAAPRFDDAAFEQAFAQVDQELVEPTIGQQSEQVLQSERVKEGPSTMKEAQSKQMQRDIRAEQFAILVWNIGAQLDSAQEQPQSDATTHPVLLRIREQRPGKSRSRVQVYSVQEG